MSEEKNTDFKNLPDGFNEKAERGLSDTQAPAYDVINERIEKTKAAMSENAERAKKNAAARLARLEYGGEYRQKLTALENKKAKEEKARREAEEENSRIETKRERERQIEEFRLREQEEARQRALRSEMIISDFDKPDKDAAENLASTAPVSENSDNQEQLEKEDKLCSEAENAIGEQGTSESDSLTAESLSDLSEQTQKNDAYANIDEENTRIILNIDPNKKMKKASAEVGDDNVLRIEMQNIGTAGAASTYVNNGIHLSCVSNPPFIPHGEPQRILYSEKENTSEKIRRADIAYGNYSEELRMLEEQENYYTAAAQSVKERRMIYEASAGTGEYPESMYSISEEYPDYDVQNFGESEGLDEYARLELERRALGASEFDIDGRDLRIYEEALYNKNAADENYRYDDVKATSDFEASSENMPEGRRASIPEYDFGTPVHGAYTKKELVRKLNKYYKEKTALEKRLRKISKEQESATMRKNAALIITKISIMKEIIELTIESVLACIYAKSKAYLDKQTGILEGCVAVYNGYCDEYELLVGRALPKIPETMPYEAAQGHITAPLPNIYYSGDDEASPDGVYDDFLEEESKRKFTDEYEFDTQKDIEDILADDRLNFETEAELRRKKKSRAERTTAAKKAIERDILVLGLRNEHRVYEYEAKRDLLASSFDVNKNDKAKTLKDIDKKIDKERNLMKKAVKLERDDNARYYALFIDENLPLKARKRSKTERLNALKMRLEVLLSEREAVNERLISLYGGSGKRNYSAKINRKAAAVRRKHAAKVYRENKKTARKIEKMKAPLDMKEKAFSLLNKKIECAATIEEKIYRLNKIKPKGDARREMIADIKSMKSAIKQSDSNLKFLMKKMKKHEERYIADRNWAILWLSIAIFTIAGIAVWYFCGAAVKNYFTELYRVFTGQGG